MLKVLVIDDDRRVCSFLQRLLSKKFGLEVLSSSDGIEGLAIINKEKPDIVFCDINMPLMDGIEILESIRATPHISNTHVVVLSSINDRNIISKMLSLGVSDYILKPLYYEEVQHRIYKIIKMAMSFARVSQSQDAGDIIMNSKKKILLADKDINFRDYFIKLYGDSYHIVEAVDGLEGFKKYISELPQIVILSEGLTIINEYTLAKKINTIEQYTKPEIFFLYENELKDDKSYSVFNGTLKKSFIPETFQKKFSEIVQHKKNIYFMFFNKIQHQFFTAIQQTIAIYLNEEVSIVSSPETMSDENYFYCQLVLKDDVRNFETRFELAAPKEGIKQISEIIKKGSGVKAVQTEIFLNFFKAIVSRLRLTFEQEGIIMIHSNPKISEIPRDFIQQKKDVLVSVATENGQVFIASLLIN